MAHDSSPGEEDDAVALVRVYCGLASADESVRPASAAAQLTIAVVDDAGRLLEVREISDDPAGYAQLGTLLVERTTGFADAAVAADSDDHMIMSLLTAAGRPLVVADDDSADDYADRFSDDDSPEELAAPQAARRAVGLARALQAGAIAAVNLPTPRELISYKPVLAAHVAMLNGRNAAATALREVLRELYPAALRAYPDPAHPLALAVLDALPEPGRLTGGGADAESIAGAVAVELTRAGAGTEDQVAAAVTALVVAISESPRRGGVNKSLAPAAADAVRQAISAVRSCDAACDALVGTLTARVAPPAAVPSAGRRATRRAAETVVTPLQPVRPSTGTRVGRRARPEPAAENTPVTPRPLTTPPVAPEPVMPPPLAPRPVTPPPAAPAASLPHRTPGNRPVSVPPPPPGMTPIVPGSRGPLAPADSGQPFRPTLTNAAISSARAERQRTVIPPRPTTRPASLAATNGSSNGATDYSLPLPAARPDSPDPGSRANWPLVNGDDRAATPTSGAPGEGRVRPPWQSDDLPTEPPSLRLVEPALGRIDGGLGDLPGASEPPPLRLVDGDAAERTARTNGRSPRRPANPGITLTALDRSSTPPVPEENDGDLLIFAAARSAWFTGHSEAASSNLDWTNPADTGWQAAEKAASPAVTTMTAAGLPRRTPQENLVPGSPLRDERPMRIVRDPASIAAHTTGYFRGWRRGQEIGGYAIGGRPGRESAGGWDFTRDGGQSEAYSNNAGYRSN
ncbi:transposase [Krasilnikovia sp. M28-CT-15]|uniref:transposase n=1 Tax=Krasilnikovia sp. M28-CT-15 TaxID=3373540 RepID=UPI003876437B